MDLSKRVGLRIQQFRKAQKLTQAELAEKTDLSDDYIGAVERGARSPSLETLDKITKALELRLRDLFDFPEEGLTSKEEVFVRLNGLLTARSRDEIQLILDIAQRIFQDKPTE